MNLLQISRTPTVAAVPAPTALPPPITESSLGHFIEHLTRHLTTSVVDPTAAAKPTVIRDKLARDRERLIIDGLISFYCELKNPDLALECLYLMKEKGFLPKIETCNQMLMLFLTVNKTQAGEHIRQMETLGAETAILNYNNTFIHHGEKFQAACVMSQAMKDDGVVVYSYSFNAYIFVMCKEGRLEEAFDLLPEMLELESESGLVPHAVAYDALIHDCCKKWFVEDSLDNAIAYKDEMISKGIEPTLVTYTLLINAMFEYGDSTTAIDLIKEMQEKGLKEDAYTYNTLMNGYGKLKQAEDHKWLYPEMVEKRIQPTLLTYNTRMLGHCICWELEEAHKVFEEMKTRGIKPDHISYNILIDGYANNTRMRGRPGMKEALRVRDEMLKNGINPTITTYKALIWGLCHNELEHAEKLLDEMVSKGLCTPGDITYRSLTRVIKDAADRVVKRSKIQELP